MTEPRLGRNRTLYDVTSCEALWGDRDENEDLLQPSTSAKIQSNYVEINCQAVNRIGKPLQFEVGTRTWIDTANHKVFCMWKGCRNSVLSSIKELEAHIAVHLQFYSFSNGTHFPCSIYGCTFIGGTEFGLRSHISMHIHHAQMQMAGLVHLRKAENQPTAGCGYKPILQVDFDGMDLVCNWEYCNMTFESVIDFFNHISLHVTHSEKGDKFEKIFHCGWMGCNKEFRNKGDLRKHSNRHVSLKKCACPFCGAWMNSWEKLYLHLKRKLTSDEFKCFQCHKTFADEQMLSHHLPVHIFHEKCELCGIVFRQKYDLDRHMQTVHCEVKNRTYRCNYDGCNEVFENRNHLVQHRIGHKIPQYKCKQCEERFVFIHELSTHKKSVHTKIKKAQLYECHICCKRMDAATKLSYHLKTKHNFLLPDGFRRFTYKLCSDGTYRVTTMKITQNVIAEHLD